MKDILLISESFLHYRVSLYNEFFELFLKSNYNLKVLVNKKGASKFENNDYSIENKFELHRTQYRFFKMVKKVRALKPNFIILFWNPYSITTWLLIFYFKFKKYPLSIWTQGISMQNPTDFLKKKLYKALHSIADSLIIYSPNELKFIKNKNQRKTFIANNTICYNDIPTITATKAELKQKYKIPFDKIILFVGRIQQRKRLDILLNIFSKGSINRSSGLVIVGPGMPDEYLETIKSSPNIMYLGEIYDKYEINEIYKCSDIFSIPGTNGLGVNHALYWGLPVITLSTVWHNPEIYYLKNDINGYLAANEDELEEKINFLLSSPNKLTEMQEAANSLIRQEASVSKMFKGFYQAINYLDNKHQNEN